MAVPKAAPCILGLDAGTQSVKAGLWTLEGDLVGLAARPLRVSTPREGWAEQDPEDWWIALAGAVRECVERASSPIVALGLAWQRETFCLTDAQHHALRPAILWLDVRAHGEARELAASATRLHGLTGVPPDVTTAPPRMRWLRQHEPELFRPEPRWLDVGAWLALRLTGSAATCAAGTDTSGLVSLTGTRWCPEAAELAGLSPSSLPELVEPGHVLGPLLPGAADALGLKAGIPVATAGGDGQVFAAAVTAGVREPGLTLSLGTSVVLGVPVSASPVSPMYRTLRAAWPGAGRLLESVLQSGTYLFRWLVDRLAPGASGLEDLERSAEPLRPGSDGLLTVPHWWGSRFPRPSPLARGSTLGWSDAHGEAHLYRSLLEGSAFEIRHLRDSIPEAAPGARRMVVVGGGGAASALWLSILREVLGCPLAVAPVEPVAAGAALLAALGAGLADPVRLAHRMCAPGEAALPDPARQAVYDRLYREAWLPWRAVSVEHSSRLGRLTREPA